MIKRAVHGRMIGFDIHIHRWVVGMAAALTLDYLIEMMPREMYSFLEYYRSTRDPVDLPKNIRLRSIVKKSYTKYALRNATYWTGKVHQERVESAARLRPPTPSLKPVVRLNQRERAAIREVLVVARASGNETLIKAMRKMSYATIQVDIVETLGMRGKTAEFHPPIKPQVGGSPSGADTSSGGAHQDDVRSDGASHG